MRRQQLARAMTYARYDGNNERWFPLNLLMILASWIVGLEAWRERSAGSS
jgi:hypothetical protein